MLTNSDEQIFVIIPAFNEATIIKDVIKEVQSARYKNIIIIDDGSTDNTQSIVQQITGIISLKLSINRGKGAAVKTGIEAAKILDADIVITIDGDGQHNPNDIKKMLELIKEGNDVVLGSRLINPKGMPIWKIAANHFGNFCTWAIYGLYVTDSQSGFRAYSKKAIELIDTKTDRYEYDSEVIREIAKNKLHYIEIPIEVRYTEYSKGKKNKQNLLVGIKTLIKMIISV